MSISGHARRSAAHAASTSIVTVITVTVNAGSVEPVIAVELTVDDLAQQAGVPVRTIREYQTMGLVPPPAKRGRVGVYRDGHLSRLRLIARLQHRGYSLAGIADLFESWSDGADLGEVLGLGPDELVHIDEPGTPATLEQLVAAVPGLVPDHLDALLAMGVVEACAEDHYCVPSPSLLQLARDALAAGYDTERVVLLLGAISRAATGVADAVIDVLATTPVGADNAALEALAARGRGLLAHGTGRMAIHALGRRLGITDEDTAPDLIRKVLGLGGG
jgi:DNA-binding transcriptional MerR regulator